MQASERVVAAAGGAWDGSLNLYAGRGPRRDVDGHGNPSAGLVATQQVDDWVYVVGPDDFDVAKHSLAAWIGQAELPEPAVIECGDEVGAWELLKLLREDCLLWQCGQCDAWIFTSNRPRVGVLQCSTCRDGGIDFRHADRHVGG